ncbi:DoxX family protein [Nocardia terpenica]|uniref:DoxX family protein n=1 Tax=Nocardia terpenica TaxID=455432 RepID=UPI0018932C2C|nr:DoxX family protein [Nocardia terpenica]MBF6065361.1 DoxX family protein [Nocardia terpenica]MBF6108933.1 DoxX family protein [Nocardia terpenica]MBF6121776.1 DoxX family protein [Nocardia terpenica]
MTIASAVLAALLAVVMTAAGAPKVLAVASMRERAAHAGISVTGYRGIGVVEIAGAAGLLAGIGWYPIGLAAGVGVLLLMIGAIITHVRIGDALAEMVPAAVTGLLAVGYFAVTALA